MRAAISVLLVVQQRNEGSLRTVLQHAAPTFSACYRFADPH